MKKNLFRFFIISIILIVSLLFAIPSYVFGIDDANKQIRVQNLSTDYQTTSNQTTQNHSTHHDLNELIPDTTISHYIQNHSTHHDLNRSRGIATTHDLRATSVIK